jgi:geranylgeranyl pyrophosphate synthase
MANDHASAEEEIARLNKEVAARLSGLFAGGQKPQYVYGLLSEFMAERGKMLRPALCLASCETVGGKAQDALHAATAIEMFHNFTLIHDDIEDGSVLRRGRPCLHVKYGVPLALNAGDGLFMLVWREALQIRGQHGQDAQRRLLSAFTHVLEGQAMELGWYRDNRWDVGEPEYLQMVEGKTGALIAASCEVGALLGGADEPTCQSLSRFGMKIGAAFQIIDDVLNIVGDEKKYRKEIGGDVREGKRTLMTAAAPSLLPGKKSEELFNLLKKEKKDEHDIGRAIELLIESGAPRIASRKAKEMVASAMSELNGLPENRGKQTLAQLAEFITRRER